MPSATKIAVGVLRPSSRKAANSECQQQAGQHGQRQHAPELAEVEVAADQRDDIARDAEEQRLAEAHDAREAPAQIEADGEHRQDQRCWSISVTSSVRSASANGAATSSDEQRHDLDDRQHAAERRPLAFRGPLLRAELLGRTRRMLIAPLGSGLGQHSFGSTMSALLITS